MKNSRKGIRNSLLQSHPFWYSSEKLFDANIEQDTLAGQKELLRVRSEQTVFRSLLNFHWQDKPLLFNMVLPNTTSAKNCCISWTGLILEQNCSESWPERTLNSKDAFFRYIKNKSLKQRISKWRLQKTTGRGESYLLRFLEKDPFVNPQKLQVLLISFLPDATDCEKTIRRLLRRQGKQRREEMRVQLRSDGRMRKSSTPFNPKYPEHRSTDKLSLMFWAIFLQLVRRSLWSMPRRWGFVIIRRFSGKLAPIFSGLNKVFQQDNCPMHKAHIILYTLYYST